MYWIDGRGYAVKPRQAYLTDAYTAAKVGDKQASVDQYLIAAHLYRPLATNKSPIVKE